MTEPTIRFDDGAAYERMMGTWSRLVGDVFLDWLNPPSGLAWIDVGCGNGAFTQLLIERCAPSRVEGIDPSEGQIRYARARPGTAMANFANGDALALPFPAASFDAAVMALVIFFVPDPAKGVVEMARVVRPGGHVAAYAWDILGGGFPQSELRAGLEAMGFTPPWPPHPEAAHLAALSALWRDAGLQAIATREIAVSRTFADFEDFWITSQGSPTAATTIAKLSAAEVELLKARLQATLTLDSAGRIVCTARAHAVKGRVPG